LAGRFLEKKGYLHKLTRGGKKKKTDQVLFGFAGRERKNESGKGKRKGGNG